MKTGLILESYKWKDVSHERVFGSAPSNVDIKPLNRDTSGIPVVYQNGFNTCVSCTITWIKQWMEKGAHLSWPFLAQISCTGPNGATPSSVLKPANKRGISTWDTFQQKPFDEAVQEASNHLIPNYSFITDYRKENLYKALTLSPLAVGVLNWKGKGDHMMAAYDVTDDGSALKCKSWWDEDHQTEEIVAWDQVEIAVSFEPFPSYVSARALTVNWLTVLLDKMLSPIKYVQ